jgi:hypothetical protein
MNLAKSLIVLKKTFSIIAHLRSEMVVFGRKSVLFLPPGLMDQFVTQQQGMLFRPT